MLYINFRDIGIQRFQIFGDICQFLFKDMGYFSKYLKGYGILGTPLPGPHYYISYTSYTDSKTDISSYTSYTDSKTGISSYTSYTDSKTGIIKLY